MKFCSMAAKKEFLNPPCNPKIIMAPMPVKGWYGWYYWEITEM